jgi:hypothetical protein
LWGRDRVKATGGVEEAMAYGVVGVAFRGGA